MTSFEQATDLAAQYFGRAPNYPKDTVGICGLVNGLVNAEKVTSIPAEKIAEKCAGASKYCPTDADLLTMARDMVRCDAVASGTFDSLAGAGNHVDAQPIDHVAMRKQYGEPETFDWKSIDHAKVKAVKDRERTLLSAIRAKYPGELSWARMADAASEFGYHDYAKAWRRAMVGGEK